MTISNLYHLKYFVDAVDLGSISASAQRNLVSHPAVSKAIHLLEEQLGVSLLIHKKKNFIVTPEGYLAADKARKLLDAAQTFSEESFSSSPRMISGSVNLGMSRTIGQTYLTSLLDKTNEIYPNIKINVNFGTTNSIIDKVVTGELSIGLTIGYQKRATLTQRVLKKGAFQLVAKASNTSTKINHKTQFILTEPREETEILKKNYQQKFKTLLSLKYEVESWDMIGHLVTNGLGVGLIPDIAIQDKPKIKPIKTNWFQCPYKIFMNKNSNFSSSSAIQAFSEVIEDIIFDN